GAAWSAAALFAAELPRPLLDQAEQACAPFVERSLAGSGGFPRGCLGRICSQCRRFAGGLLFPGPGKSLPRLVKAQTVAGLFLLAFRAPGALGLELGMELVFAAAPALALVSIQRGDPGQDFGADTFDVGLASATLVVPFAAPFFLQALEAHAVDRAEAAGAILGVFLRPAVPEDEHDQPLVVDPAGAELLAGGKHRDLDAIERAMERGVLDAPNPEIERDFPRGGELGALR